MSRARVWRRARPGFAERTLRFPATLSEEALLRTVDELNRDDAVDAVLVQLPLPKHIDTARVLEAIDPRKDVDGFHPMNAGRLLQGKPSPVPCTPAGILELLRREGIGRFAARAPSSSAGATSSGKPMALLLLQNHATVTIAHSRTRDLPGLCREADLLVAAIGRPGFVTGDFVKEGAVLVDVGINRVTSREDVAEVLPGRRRATRGVREERIDARGRLRPGDGVPAVVAIHAGPRRRGAAHDRHAPAEHARPLPGKTPRMILKVGLTGGLASGKSTVAARLREHGVPVLDADLIVHDLYRAHSAGARAVADAFGPEFLAPDSSVDRRKLSAHVFHDPAELARLNGLIHPLVRDEQARWFAALEAKGEALGVVEASLLVETGGRQRFDVLVTVSAPTDVRLARAIRRSGETDPNELVRRMSAQFSDAVREEVADIVIHADGTKEELLKKVDDLAAELRALAGKK